MDSILKKISKLFGEDECQCESCGQEGTDDLHSCPYAQELNNDDSALCNCCEYCTQECANDI